MYDTRKLTGKLIAVTTALIIAGAGGVSAKENTAPENPKAANSSTVDQDSISSVTDSVRWKADRFIWLSGDQFTISPSASNYLSDSEMLQVELSIQTANEQIRVAQADPNLEETTSHKVVTFTEVSGPEISDTDGDDVSPYFREGKTAVNFHWWGVRFYYSKTTVQWIGAGVTVGGLWIPEPFVSKVLGSLGAVSTLTPGGIWFDLGYDQLATISTNPFGIIPRRAGFQ